MEGHERKKKLSSSVVSLYVVRFNPVLKYAKNLVKWRRTRYTIFWGHIQRGAFWPRQTQSMIDSNVKRTFNEKFWPPLLAGLALKG